MHCTLRYTINLIVVAFDLPTPEGDDSGPDNDDPPPLLRRPDLRRAEIGLRVGWICLKWGPPVRGGL